MEISVRSPGVWKRALRLFGAEEKAIRWLRTSLSELHDRTPEDVLNDDPESEAVDALLDRIEYGVFS